MSWLAKRTIGAVFLLGSMLVFMLAVTGWTAEKCHVCELDLSDFVNTRYTIVTRDGETLDACSFYCAVMILHEKKKERKKIKEIQVVDYNTGEEIDAKKAIYVIGSAVKEAVHSKSWLAFGNMNSARVFILRNGGMSRKFHAAEKSMLTRLADKARIPQLLKNQQTSGCLKCHAIGKARRMF